MGLAKVAPLVAAIAGLCAYSLYIIPDPEFDAFKALTSSLQLSDGALLVYRVGCITSVVFVLARLLLDKAGTLVTANGVDRKPYPVLMIGFLRLAPFTVWSWIMQGIYFALAITLQCSKLLSLMPDPRLAKLAYILFEVSFSVSLLVTVIVTFVLIPSATKAGIPVDHFFRPAALAMHNANIYFMVCELIFNTVDVFHYQHLPYVFLYGLTYTIFGWILAFQKGFFFYFFMNYNFPQSIIAHLSVLSAIGAFYSIGWFISAFLDRNHSWTCLLLLAATFCVCKIQDPSITAKSNEKIK